MTAASKAAVGTALVALTIALSGCGGGGGGGGGGGDTTTTTTIEPPSCTPAEHCTHCDPGTQQCTACVDGYGLDDKKDCIASCLLDGNWTPAAPPPTAGIYNGIAWPMECVKQTDGEYHFFAIGDWGGVQAGVPADNTRNQGRPFKDPIDKEAQALVANVMGERAKTSRPSFILNVGDNFYWGGIPKLCGTSKPADACSDPTFESTFEGIYKGDGLDGVPWFSVLGNHDYGGTGYQQGWDLQIYRTFCPNSRWRMPGLWWSQKVQFKDFSIDVFMLDSNVNDAVSTPGHSICEDKQGVAPGCNVPNATMADANGCKSAMTQWWNDAVIWLKKGLKKSTAEWQIAVTHFPPTYRPDDWIAIAHSSGLDLVVNGHVHDQELHLVSDDRNPAPLKGNFKAHYIITGGGGGITSEHVPTDGGADNAYGFVDFTVSRTEMKIDMLSHGGENHNLIIMRTETIKPRDKTKFRAELLTDPAPVPAAEAPGSAEATRSPEALPAFQAPHAPSAAPAASEAVIETASPAAAAIAATSAPAVPVSVEASAKPESLDDAAPKTNNESTHAAAPKAASYVV